MRRLEHRRRPSFRDGLRPLVRLSAAAPMRHLPVFLGCYRRHDTSKSVEMRAGEPAHGYREESEAVYRRHFGRRLPSRAAMALYRLAHKTRRRWRRYPAPAGGTFAPAERAARGMVARSSRRPGYVSVVVPAFNGERGLTRCIDSVLVQTHPDREVTVVDDGSTDATSQIAGSYGNRIRLITQANLGECAARNAGFSHATASSLPSSTTTTTGNRNSWRRALVLGEASGGRGRQHR